MMKKAVCAMMTCVIFFSLASCGAMLKSEIVGTYDWVSATGNYMNITEEQIDALKAIGVSATLEVRDDGTATMDIAGEKTELTYNLNKMTFTSDGKTFKFTFDGKKLTFTGNGSVLVFVKQK